MALASGCTEDNSVAHLRHDAGGSDAADTDAHSLDGSTGGTDVATDIGRDANASAVDAGGDAMDAFGVDADATDADTSCADDDQDGVCNAVDRCAGYDDAVDTDGDGTPDGCDECAQDADKVAPGTCGCGVADQDSDGDGVLDCNDQCPTDAAKTAPGTCGCGVAETDTDGDGTADCVDQCPDDPAKTQPGVCGCGWADPSSGTNCPNDPGNLDPSFGTGGLTVVSFRGGRDAVRALALVSGADPILIGGFTRAAGGDYDFLAARFDSAGNLDAGFGSAGWTATDFNGGADRAFAMAADASTGAFVLAGGAYNGGQQPALAKYGADGSLDTSFDTDGRRADSIVTSGSYRGVEMLAGGALVVSGDGFSSRTSGRQMIAARYTAAGGLDTGFDTDGYRVFGAATLHARAMSVLDSGALVVSGYHEQGFDDAAALLSLSANGATNNGWGNAGTTLTDATASGMSSEEIAATAVDAQGRLVAVGNSDVAGGGRDLLVARYKTDGTLDTSFAGDGLLTHDVSGGFDDAYGVAVQADGKILVVGRAQIGTTYQAVIIRLNADGTLDGSFGQSGTKLVDVTPGEDSDARAVALQSDGMIVVVGDVDAGPDQDIFVLRLYP